MDPRILSQNINRTAVVYDAAREEYHVPEYGSGEDVISRIIPRSEVVVPIPNQAPPNPGNAAQLRSQDIVQSSADARDRNDSLALTETNLKRYCEDRGRLNVYNVTHVHDKIENWAKACSGIRDSKLPPAATQQGCEVSEYEDYFDWLVLRSSAWETEPSTDGKELHEAAKRHLRRRLLARLIFPDRHVPGDSRSNTSAKPKLKEGEVIKPRGWRAIPRRRKQDRRITSHYIRSRYRLNKDAAPAGVPVNPEPATAPEASAIPSSPESAPMCSSQDSDTGTAPRASRHPGNSRILGESAACFSSTLVTCKSLTSAVSLVHLLARQRVLLRD